jgi:RNA polymerase sigma factor (sigma-70 family)
LSNGSLLASEAFETLYTEYAVPLRGIAIHRYHVPPDEAEELVHEAFIAYLERHTAIRDVKGWLMGTVRFKCTHYWRERKREAPLLPEQEEAAHPTAEQDVHSAVAKLTVATAIRQLGENCRETIRRFYWLDESLHEIAACYAISENNVKKMLFTCRRRMRDFISRHLRQQT